LSLLLVLCSATRGVSPDTPVFPSPQKPTFLNSNSIWTSGTSVMSLWLGWSREHSLCLTLNLLNILRTKSSSFPPLYEKDITYLPWYWQHFGSPELWTW